MDEPWLTIVGIGEEGLCCGHDGIRMALQRAQRIFGGQRHLAMVQAGERGQAWPVPFDIAPVLAWRGRPVVVLASGDPFWYGVGSTLVQSLSPQEWTVFPAPSTFSWAAARLGWRLEAVECVGLHAQPLTVLRPLLRRGARLIVLLRDAAALHAAAQWLTQLGYGGSQAWALQCLGGRRERVMPFVVHQAADLPPLQSPLALALDLHEGPRGLPATPGLPDAEFVHDGQITKAPMRALTLSALAPRRGEVLWDLGAGSGSVSIEWCLAGGSAHAVECRSDRAGHIRANAERFGVIHRLTVHEGRYEALLASLPAPDAVFVGGGFDEGIFAALQASLPQGCRLVVNAVTLETVALLQRLHARRGGQLWQLSWSAAQPLGAGTAWQPTRPWVQWCWEVEG
ncbi:MAG: precorrin-6y C5,15-methyltransferase (decarboxylating) subunit CbiE [Tepidimonas taiwanensis]|nr:precorrin-6y C5,15-methyltransferase (decarboxylating) subunit CbiE [Tepidimonas taiwanensis]